MSCLLDVFGELSFKGYLMYKQNSGEGVHTGMGNRI